MTSKPLPVRFPAETHERLAALAAARGVKKSEVALLAMIEGLSVLEGVGGATRSAPGREPAAPAAGGRKLGEARSALREAEARVGVSDKQEAFRAATAGVQVGPSTPALGSRLKRFR